MNVTIKLDDRLCREARHRAVDRGISLSAWLAQLVRQELEVDAPHAPPPMTLLESLALGEFDQRGFEVPRDAAPPRPMQFP
jgi:hypothetical protein